MAEPSSSPGSRLTTATFVLVRAITYATLFGSGVHGQILLAQGADVLVHEAMYLPAVDRLVARVPYATTLKKHLLASHTSAQDAGRVAQTAGVKMLVLSHLAPPDDPAITDEMWIDAARVHFRGPVIVGKDLLEI